MKILKKIVVYICLILIYACVPCLAESADYKPCTRLIDWDWKFPNQNSIIFDKKQYNWVKSINNLTKHFCKSVSSLQCVDTSDWDYAIDYFDASQSMFLSILCESVKLWWNYSDTLSFLNKKSFLDFGIVTSETWYQEDCHRYWSMNSCDYAYNLPIIFNKIMNDLFSIKQARFFWIDSIQESFSAKKAANAFFTWNFFWLDIQKWLENWICSESSTYYNKTCKTLEGYMTDAYNLLKNTTVINVKELQSQNEDGINCEKNFIWNIAYCGLLDENSDYKFLNVVYNEYFWYKLFLSYYRFYIDWTEFLDSNSSSDKDKLEMNMEKISLVDDQLLKSKQAITLSFRTISEISYSFPLHIWFLMYHEDAQFFMENISKIYPPVRTLYDKLRNVQIKES